MTTNRRTLTFGSLFAGIGGVDLGFERAGLECVWQVEIDPFARRVLEKHWPHVRRHDDVRTFPPRDPDEWRCDVVAGGFPCQDLSVAGKRAGIDGVRSGLWAEFERVLRDLRPGLVVVENVPRLLDGGLDRVLGSLAALGFDAEWAVLSAAGAGLPQARDRVFIVAHAHGFGREASYRVFDRDAGRCFEQEIGVVGRLSRLERGNSGRVWAVPDAGLHGMADGVPTGLDADRLRGLGNAVVPQIAEWIARRILETAP